MIEQPAASSGRNPSAKVRRSIPPHAVVPAVEVPTLQATKIPLLGRRQGRFPHVSGYEILGELGRGGMGVVYRARQQKLNRVVALKMLLHPEEADPSDVIRFRSEAEAVASLKHPHIVQVHEFGTSDGNAYFAMEFLNAGTLHTRIQDDAPFKPDDAAKLVEKLARAVHAAHSQGIVHRDLKPGNVLFDAAGEPRVTDFGLAKRTSHHLTRTQAIMGTPGYMPPEQASGNARRAGPAADIYALGVILYECLTKELPFQAGESLALLHKVIHEPAPSLRSKNKALPRDLDLICLKCLEKNPNDRYPTAASLADDLARFVSKETVSVRPAGPVERAVKWAKRRPTHAAAFGLGVLAIFLAVFGLGAMTLWQTARSAHEEAETQRRAAIKAGSDIAAQKLQVDQQKYELEQSNAKLKKTGADLEKSNQCANTALLALDAEKTKVETALASEKAAVQKLELEQEKVTRLRYFRDVGAARMELHDRNFLRAMQLLDGCPDKLRGWEWWHVYQAAHPEQGSGHSRHTPIDAAFDPATGTNVFTVDTIGAITRFNFATGQGLDQQIHPSFGVETMKLSADGKRALAIGTDENQPQKPFEISVWDTVDAKRVAKWTGMREWTTAHAISGDGHRVIVGRKDAVRVFDVPSGKELPSPKGVQPAVSIARLGRTGVIAAVATQKEVVVWETATGSVKKRIPSHADGDSLEVASVGNDDNTLILGTRNGTLLFDTVKGDNPVRVSKAHVGPISNVAYHPGGAIAATAGEDGAVRLWDIATGKLLREFYGHTRRVHGLNFNAKGDYLVSCDEGRAFRVWPVSGSQSPVKPMVGPADATGRVAFDATGARTFDLGDQRGARLWPGNGNSIKLAVPEGQRITVAAFHPARPQVAFGTDKGWIYVWEYTENPRLIGKLEAAVEHVEYSADGGRLLAGRQALVTVWDTIGRRKLRELGVHFKPGCIALSPDGKWVVAGVPEMFDLAGVDTEVGFRSALHDPKSAAAPDKITALGFTPRGDRVVVGTRNWLVHFCKLQHGTEVERTFSGHTSAVRSFAFNADGTRMATGGSDGVIKVWDLKTGEEALGLSMGEREPVERLGWIPQVGWTAALPNKMPVVFEGVPRPLAIKAP